MPFGHNIAIALPRRTSSLSKLPENLVRALPCRCSRLAHRCPIVAMPAIPIDHMSQEGQKHGAIKVIFHNIVPSIAATRDVVDGPREFQTQRTCRGSRVQRSQCAITRPYLLF